MEFISEHLFKGDASYVFVPGLALGAFGVIFVVLGLNAQRTRRLSNARSLWIVTGTSEFQGKSAVFLGEVIAFVGFVFIGLAVLAMAATGLMVFSKLRTSRARPAADGSSQNAPVIVGELPKQAKPELDPNSPEAKKALADAAEIRRKAFEEHERRTREMHEQMLKSLPPGTTIGPGKREPFGIPGNMSPPVGAGGPFGSSRKGGATESGSVKLPTPTKILPGLRFDVQATQKLGPIKTPISGDNDNDALRNDRLLVGLLVRQSDDIHHSISSVQAVYQFGERYEYGQRLGSDGGKATLLLAPPGFVVSGLHAHLGGQIMSLQLAYMELESSGTLRRESQILSDLVGEEFGRKETLQGDGAPIVSIYAAHRRNDLVAIGLVKAAKLEWEKPGSGTSSSAGAPYASPSSRKWTSADGKFSLEAVLVEQVGAEVRLKKPDGSIVKIDKSKLSTADQEWLAQNP